MPKFKVVYKSGEFVKAIITAKNKEDAENIADKMDGGDFETVDGSYIWQLHAIEQIKAKRAGKRV